MAKNNYELGEIIKNARLNKKMTQKELADKLFVTHQAVGNWERKNIKPDREILKKLCEILELDYTRLSQLINNELYLKNNIIFLKRVIISLVITMLFLIIILCLAKNALKNNTIEIYEGYIDSFRFPLSKTIFIKTAQENILYLGSLPTYLENEYNVKLYYYEYNNERLLIETGFENGITIMESNQYHEFFSNEFNINNLYIDFIPLKKEDVVYSYKMIFENTYSNKVKKREKSIIEEKDDFEQKKFLNSDLLEKNDYKVLANDKDSYYKENFIYNIITNEFIYNDKETYILLSLNEDYIFAKKYSSKKKKYLFKFNYNIKTDNLECVYGECDDVQTYIDLIINEIEKIN